MNLLLFCEYKSEPNLPFSRSLSFIAAHDLGLGFHWYENKSDNLDDWKQTKLIWPAFIGFQQTQFSLLFSWNKSLLVDQKYPRRLLSLDNLNGLCLFNEEAQMTPRTFLIEVRDCLSSVPSTTFPSTNSFSFKVLQSLLGKFSLLSHKDSDHVQRIFQLITSC